MSQNCVSEIILMMQFQVHLKERMLALEEKNNLSNELNSTKKKLEELGSQKVILVTTITSSRYSLFRTNRDTPTLVTLYSSRKDQVAVLIDL